MKTKTVICTKPRTRQPRTGVEVHARDNCVRAVYRRVPRLLGTRQLRLRAKTTTTSCSLDLDCVHQVTCKRHNNQPTVCQRDLPPHRHSHDKSPRCSTTELMMMFALMGLLQLRFEHDSATRCVRFERDSSTMQHPTRSYVLSSTNEHVNSFALL